MQNSFYSLFFFICNLSPPCILVSPEELKTVVRYAPPHSEFRETKSEYQYTFKTPQAIVLCSHTWEVLFFLAGFAICTEKVLPNSYGLNSTLMKERKKREKTINYLCCLQQEPYPLYLAHPES